ncbi:MAG: hypothetical protein JO345_34845 [Streptosporangiaceae bacterium]|nr:hypothetical protein [Streptosporangiaceae bacterium]
MPPDGQDSVAVDIQLAADLSAARLLGLHTPSPLSGNAQPPETGATAYAVEVGPANAR